MNEIIAAFENLSVRLPIQFGFFLFRNAVHILFAHIFAKSHEAAARVLEDDKGAKCKADGGHESRNCETGRSSRNETVAPGSGGGANLE